jgi:tetratricopeptide (TPR) repeat protein
MLARADMAAFMERVASDYSEDKNSGAWGYAIVDALSGDQIPRAQDILDRMAEKPAPEILSADHLRPWVMAFAGRAETARSDMAKLGRLLPGATLLGHRALLAEGMGDIDGALAVYEEAPDEFAPPDPRTAGTPAFLASAIAFNGQRLLALRQAELLRAAGRGPDAVALLERLAAAAPDDGFVAQRLADARSSKSAPKPRTLRQAMALAIADEADVVEQRQTIMGMMVGRGAKAPFNQLLSSLRQSALLLDPDNGDIRLEEVGSLYRNGYFEAALRVAQSGSPRREQAAQLAISGGLAALQLGSPEALNAMVERSLSLEADPQSKLSAASALSEAGRTDRALQLIDQALRGGLDEDRKLAALLTRGQTHFQGGNVQAAIVSAREARTLADNATTQQFLSSMLVKSPQRPEGLQIMREMMVDSPGDVGLMNNFGYSLIDGYASEEELEEGFKMLKQASRLSPDEPNLLDSLGWAYYQYGDFKEAERYLTLAIAAYEPFDHWELHDHMGDIRWRLGEEEAARASWQEAVRARPPAHELPAISSKIASGLTKPAPVRRDTPEVPLERRRGPASDI